MYYVVAYSNNKHRLKETFYVFSYMHCINVSCTVNPFSKDLFER